MDHTHHPFLPLFDLEQHGLPTIGQVDPSSDPDLICAIYTCSSIPDARGISQPSLFHLLSCGHIVAIDETDRRCGRNCYHATRWTTAYGPNINPGTRTIHCLNTPSCPPISTTQHTDQLYCEVCNGIPIDKYKKMHPPSSELFPSDNVVLRRCLGLSRSLIAATTPLPVINVEDLLDSMFPIPQYQPHDLLCGHRVWCEAAKRCGPNCASIARRADGVCTKEGRWRYGIVCSECVLRADQVYRRYARVEARMAGSG